MTTRFHLLDASMFSMDSVRSISGFDLYWLSKLEVAKFQRRPGLDAEEVWDLFLGFSGSWDGSGDELMTLACRGILRAVMPELRPTAYVSELEIEDISADQIEGAKFRIFDFGESGLEVHCRSVDFAISAKD